MATRNLNKVMLIGNLTGDPEVRYTPQNTAVASFVIATNREWKEEGEFSSDLEVKVKIVESIMIQLIRQFGEIELN